MLKTNSKKARENIRAYILENFTPEAYDPDFWRNVEKNRKYPHLPLDRFSVAAHFILYHFYEEKIKLDKRRLTHEQYFFEWAQGLPSILDTCYYYNRSAVDDLGAILEENNAEKSRFNEGDAGKMLTYLIYRELLKGGAKNA